VRYLFSAQALRGLPTLLRLGVVRGPTVSCGWKYDLSSWFQRIWHRWS